MNTFQNKRWGFIGCGTLSQAIITGALEKKLLKPRQIFASNRSQPKLRKFTTKTKIVNLWNNNLLVLENCEIIVLGTKPQDLLSLLKEIAPHLGPHHKVISLAAGVSSNQLSSNLKNPDSIFRVMTNLPASIQQGVFAISAVRGRSKELNMLVDFFSTLGFSFAVGGNRLRADQVLNEVTAGMASGTGFIFYFMESFYHWFCKRGFSEKLARTIVDEIFSGTALLSKSRPNLTLRDLKTAVTSKKGTTLAGLKTMTRLKSASALHAGLDSALNRANEIAKSLRQKQK